MKTFHLPAWLVPVLSGRYQLILTLQYRKKPLPEGYAVTWEAKPLFVDTYQAPATPDRASEYPTTLVQGLSNAAHTLEVIPNGDGPVPLAAFRVYTPPLQ